MSELHAEAPQVTVSEGLAQGPYVAARTGFEPTTPRTKGINSTNAQQRPIHSFIYLFVRRRIRSLIDAGAKLIGSYFSQYLCLNRP